MKVKSERKSLSRVQLFTTPWTAAYQAPPSMGFSRQEYWSGVPLPFPYKVNKMPKYSDSNLTEVLTGSRGFPGGSDGKESD